MTKLKELECEWCAHEITFNEFCSNSGLCDSCFPYTLQNKTKTKIVRGCDNYLECGNDANVSMGNGSMCDPCREKSMRSVELVKKVFMDSPQGKKALAKFINGLQKALNVE